MRQSITLYYTRLCIILCTVICFHSNIFSQCPDIQVIELLGVPGFAETDELVICGAPDTLAFLIFIEEPGNISGAQMNVKFKQGMQYAGFESTAYASGTISNIDPNPSAPKFLLEGVTKGVYVGYIGVEATCDADINAFDYMVDLDFSFIFEDASGNFMQCRQGVTPIRTYNSTIKEPVINFRSTPNTTLKALGSEYCSTVTISQDGLNAYLTNFDFQICNLDLTGNLMLKSIKIGSNDLSYSYDGVTKELSAQIDDSFFSDGSFDENEIVAIKTCYQIDDCPTENTQIVDYKASYGCHGDVCQSIQKTAEIRIRPSSGPEPFAIVEKLSNPGVCGDPGIIELSMYAVNKGTTVAVLDSALGLFTDVTLGFETCATSSMDISRVVLGSTEIGPDQYRWVNGDLVVDFTTLTADPDGDGGLTDADKDGFFDDLPGDQELHLQIELSFVCALPPDPGSIACSSVDCSFAKFFVNAKRDCGQSFTFEPEVEEFDIVNGATYVELKDQDDITKTLLGYKFGTVGNNGSCNPLAKKEKEIEFCYIYEIENVDSCPEANTSNELQVVFSGSPLIVNDVQFKVGSGELYVDGALSQSGFTGTFTSIDNSNRVMSLPIGDVSVGKEICYRYTLEADTAQCSPAVYMTGTHQVIETCTQDGCTCKTVKACDTALFQSDPSDCGCVCDISSGANIRRYNLGYTDPSMTEKIALEDVPAEDLNRYLPCDTMLYEGWMKFNTEHSVGELYQWYYAANITNIGNNGWAGNDDTELMIDANNSELVAIEVSKEGSGGVRTLVDISSLSDCLDMDGGGSTGFFAYAGKTPWSDVTYNTPMCNSTYEYHDGNYIGVYFRNFNKLEDCRGTEVAGWEESNCLDQFKDTYNIEKGDSVFFRFLLPLTKNVKAFANRAADPDFTFKDPQILNVASGNFIDEFDSDCIVGLSNCRENTPFFTFCPMDINAVTELNVDDCGGTVEHNFNVVQTTPVNWYSKEYRPYFTMEDLEVPIFAPLMYCGDAVLTSKAGVEYPLVVDSYTNHSCATVGGVEYCSVSSGTQGEVNFNLEANGFPGLGVGYGAYADEFTISYKLCKVCPSNLTNLSDYQIKYDYRICDVLNGACFRCNQSATNTSNELPGICGLAGATIVDRNQSYYDALNMDTLYRKDDVVSEDLIASDSSKGFGALTQTQEKEILSSGSPGISEEINTFTICADNTDPEKELHVGIIASFTMTNSVMLANVYDDTMTPLATANINTVSQTSSSTTYSIELPNLDAPGVKDCTTFKIGTKLMYCPEDPEVAEICVTVTSGCMDPEIMAAVAGGSSPCNSSQTCYQYVTQEAGIQADFIAPEPNVEFGLCQVIPMAIVIKNVKEATVTDIIVDIDLPLVGMEIVSGSFMASYPNDGNLGGVFYAIDDPLITGNNLLYSEDQVFSPEIHTNGLLGIGAPDKKNFIVIKWEVITKCDEFVSGSTASLNVEAVDPCSPNPLSSGTSNSNQIVISGADPENFAQILVTAKPSEAYCGQEVPTFTVTGQNISEVPSGDSVLMCITLPPDLTYSAESMRYAIPAGLSTGLETLNTVNGFTQVCFQGYENMPVGGAFTLNFEAAFDVSSACGDYLIGVDVKELVEDQGCPTAPTGKCDVFVQSSVNPNFTVTLKGPIETTDLKLVQSCGGGVDPVEVCYEVTLKNPGPDYTGDIMVDLHDDQTSNQVLDYFDPVLGNSVFADQFIAGGASVTLSACFDVAAINACPVILNMSYESTCSCKSEATPFESILPDFLEKIPPTSLLCPGQEIGIDTCGNYNFSYDPANNIIERNTDDSLYISIVDPSILTKMTVSGTIGECDFEELRFIRGVTDFELEIINGEVCEDENALLGLTIPADYVDYVTVEWSPATFLDDPMRVDPLFNSPTPGTYSYEVTLSFNNGCELKDNVDVIVHPNGVVGIGGDTHTCEYPKAITLTSDPGFDYYEWYQILPGDLQAIKGLTFTESFTSVLAPGDYIVKAYDNDAMCPSVSGIWTIGVKECVDLELEKTICEIDNTPNIDDKIKYCIKVCNRLEPDSGLVYTANDIIVGDALPAQVMFTGNYMVTGTGSYTAPAAPQYVPGTPLGWDVGTLVAGDCATLEIEVELVDYGTIKNVADITGSDHEDIDSEEDNDDGDQSEDDEDNAEFTLEEFDLALKKTICPDQIPLPPNAVGNYVKYCIEVINQGGVDAYNVIISDYYPTAVEPVTPSATVNVNWTDDTMGTATYDKIPFIGVGTSVTIELLTQIVAVPALNANNFAEITSAEDADGDNPKDSDSRPDDDQDNDGDFVDNGVDNEEDDEDDHDPATFYIPIVDMALKKTTLHVGTVVIGDEITYDIEVCNQGNVPSEQIVINDYIPSGMVLNGPLSPGWVDDGMGTSQFTITSTEIGGDGKLSNGECVHIPITLDVVSGTDPLGLKNVSEISSFQDDMGFDITNLDIDSDGDDNPSNDGDMEDNNTSNLNGDEDDSDFEQLDMFDLALKKTPITGGAYSYGQAVTFEIEIFNQGNIAADQVEVTDYIPCGYDYLSSNDPKWAYVMSSGKAKTTLSIADGDFSPMGLLPGTSHKIQITLEVKTCADSGAWTNVAEISGFTDSNGDPVRDVDSKEDDMPDNDGDPVDDATEDPDDEDDADLAVIEIFDLALNKVIVTPEPFAYNDLLEFKINLCNQGNVDAYQVEITDHIPSGFTYDPLDNLDWSGAAPAVTQTIDGPLLPATCESRSIFLTLVQSNDGLEGYTNIAEISHAENEDEEEPVDADSMADDNPGNDGDPVDNAMDDPDDQDDHDPELVNIFDLALAKTTDATGPFKYGEQITFDITIFNQGTVDATNISIAEYLPCGFKYLDVNDGDWNYDVTTGEITALITDVVPATMSHEISLTVEIQYCSEDGAYKNSAEISGATDKEGEPQSDIDSTPNDDPTDDGDMKDNATDGSDEDEDDSDFEEIEIFDLAQKKELVTEGPFAYGDTVCFNITVINQGNVAAKNIILSDYIPVGFDYDDSLNEDWNGAAPLITTTILDTLYHGDEIEVPVCLILKETTGGVNNYTNESEISSAQDEAGDDRSEDDADSKTDDDPENDGDPIDDATENPMDEDDHDFAFVEIFDLAQNKTTMDDGPFKYGDEIIFHIEVFNQGNVPATQVKVVDFMPCGYTYDPDENPDWTALDEELQETTIDLIAPGESVIVDIKFTIQACAESTEAWLNRSEITEARDEDDIVREDTDSFPDDNWENDGEMHDNEVLNAEGDEDDSDFVMVEVFDLALAKKVDPAGAYAPGMNIKFVFEICNQGNVDAYQIGITDYIPVGLAFANIPDNDHWDHSGSTAHHTIVGPLVTEECIEVEIYLTMLGFAPADLVNMGEISSAQDIDGMSPVDADSMADEMPDNDGDMIDDDMLGGGGILGEDEDDSDFAQVFTCLEFACESRINVSLNDDCSLSLTADMLIQPALFPEEMYEITVTDDDGVEIGNTFDFTHVGSCFKVSVGVPLCNDYSCWGYVCIEDKYLPVLDCTETIISACANVDNVAPPTVSENCTNFKLKMVNEQIETMSCDIYVSRIERTWVATDDFGNESLPCTQVILLERININSITCPADYVVECGTEYSLDVNGRPHYELTGVPQTMGVDVIPLSSDLYCNSQVSYTDLEIGSTDCSEKFMRIWEVREWWCSGELTASCPQAITIRDTEGPSIECLDPAKFSTTAGYDCSAHVIVPEIKVTDACHNANFTYRITYNEGQLLTNGGDIFLPTGKHEISIQVLDECGNISTCIWEVEIVDEIQPVAVCERNTVISISQGSVDLLATVFDDGSWDECGLATFEVARMDTYCDVEDLEFGPTVSFCCADALLSPMVALRVTDYAGNTNMCMVSVEVQDKVLPTISCPDDVVIDCKETYDLENLENRFDDATVIDNCNNLVPEEQVFADINSCGIGTITRVFTVTDGDYTTSCTQVITVVSQNPFVEGNIVWPEDYETEDICDVGELDPEDLQLLENGERLGYPRYAEGVCDLVGYKYEDEVFVLDINSPGCIKILRTWKVLNWCNEDEDGFDQFTRIQTIKVYNTEAPEIICPTEEIIECVFNVDCGPGAIKLEIEAEDDCTLNDNLYWSWTIDGTINGTGNDASGSYDLGIHDIEWRVSDQCGNESSCSYQFEIRNCKSPIPICIQGLAVDLVPMNLDSDPEFEDEMATVWAVDFDAGSYHSCNNPIIFSFSDTNLDSTSVTFDCSHRGEQRIEMWVTDVLTGAQDFCETYILVQDNNGIDVCKPIEENDERAEVSGNVTTEDARKLKGVSMRLEGSGLSDQTTDENGNYAFDAMPLGGVYDLKPEKDIEYLNGVSTLDLVLIQRHILGTNLITSPYQLISSDVNRDGVISSLDLITLRKLILGIYQDFPENESWRFVSKDYQFVDPQDPFVLPMEEAYHIDPLNTDMSLDFIGMKVGDVNNSVQLLLDESPMQNRSENDLELGIPDQDLEEGEQLTFALKLLNEETSLSGIQMSLTYDATRLEVLGIEGERLKIEAKHYSIDAVRPGLITLSWHDDLGQEIEMGNEDLLLISVLAKAKINLINAFEITNSYTQTEAYTSGNVRDVTLQSTILEEETEILNNLAAVLYQNVPNPWQQKTEIKFYLPVEGEAELRFYNSQGQILKTMKQKYASGMHKLKIDSNELGASGMVIYELIYKEQLLSKRMILLD